MMCRIRGSVKSFNTVALSCCLLPTCFMLRAYR